MTTHKKLQDKKVWYCFCNESK